VIDPPFPSRFTAPNMVALCQTVWPCVVVKNATRPVGSSPGRTVVHIQSFSAESEVCRPWKCGTNPSTLYELHWKRRLRYANARRTAKTTGWLNAEHLTLYNNSWCCMFAAWHVFWIFAGWTKREKKEGVNNVNLIISLVYCQEIAK